MRNTDKHNSESQAIRGDRGLGRIRNSSRSGTGAGAIPATPRHPAFSHQMPSPKKSGPLGGVGGASAPVPTAPTHFATDPEGGGVNEVEGSVIVRRGPVIFNPTQSKVTCPGNEDCDPKRAVVFKCRDCGHGVMIKQGCKSRRCEPCYKQTRKKRAKGAREKLHPFKSGFHTMVLTLPKQLQPLVVDPKMMKKWRDASFNLLEKWLQRRVDAPGSYRAGAGEWTHPAGEKDPEEWFPHLNFLIPLVLVDHEAGDIVSIPYFVQKDHLALLKRAYRRMLCKVFNVTIDGNINLWVQFRIRDKGRVGKNKAHAYRYFPRPFPKWSPKKGDLSRVNWTRWYGNLCNRGKIRGWTATKAVLWENREFDWDKAQESEGGYELSCDECGGDMERVFTTSVEDAERYLEALAERNLQKKFGQEARAG